jgi:PPK2 family polyphosphate:nucleotide phosphotransferase
MKRRASSYSERYRAPGGRPLELGRRAADETKLAPGGKAEAESAAAELNKELERLQELLWAGHRQRVLVVLQGMDTSGKDGVIRHVFDGVNPVGVKVASFKAPTVEELAHDFLWRVHSRVPADGELVIFNRSHYEDVLVVRVHELVPESVWRRRYDQIREFERLLAETGTTILKFFLHISNAEQKQRLEERLADPSKQWKFDPRDLAERARWKDYQKAYGEAIGRTSMAQAPWYVVPSDKKWYRDLVVARILVEALTRLKLEPPKPTFDPAAIRIP